MELVANVIKGGGLRLKNQRLHWSISAQCCIHISVQFCLFRGGQLAGGEGITYKFNMAALAAYLKKQAERGAKASYYNIDILKYQVSWLEVFPRMFEMEDFIFDKNNLLHCTIERWYPYRWIFLRNYDTKTHLCFFWGFGFDLPYNSIIPSSFSYGCFNSQLFPSGFLKGALKGALSGLGQCLATGSPLDVMKNAFHFTLKALSVLKIIKFLSWFFGHVSKRVD